MSKLQRNAPLLRGTLLTLPYADYWCGTRQEKHEKLRGTNVPGALS